MKFDTFIIRKEFGFMSRKLITNISPSKQYKIKKPCNINIVIFHNGKHMQASFDMATHKIYRTMKFDTCKDDTTAYFYPIKIDFLVFKQKFNQRGF